VKAGDTIEDEWIVEGLRRDNDGRVLSQRTWIHGVGCKQRFVILDFGAGSIAGVPQTTGTKVHASIAVFPGLGLKRAVFVDDPKPSGAITTVVEPGTIADAFRSAAELVALNPFHERTPVSLRGRISLSGLAGFVDADQNHIEFTSDVDQWMLGALTGPGTVDMFGELEAGKFRPLTLGLATGVVAL